MISSRVQKVTLPGETPGLQRGQEQAVGGRVEGGRFSVDSLRLIHPANYFFPFRKS